MTKDQAIEKIYRAAREAKEHGVRAEYTVIFDDIRRPLKTVHGAVNKLNNYSRHYLWDGFLGVSFVGANGKIYTTAKKAERHGGRIK